jgi:hypothetical protein
MCCLVYFGDNSERIFLSLLSDLKMTTYANEDWGGCPSSRRSTTR